MSLSFSILLYRMITLSVQKMDLFVAELNLVYPDKMNILAAYEHAKKAKASANIPRLRASNPKLESWSDEEILGFYKTAVSCFQSKLGGFLEKFVEETLTREGIPFQRQVQVDEDGMIRSGQGDTIPDIVFGNPKIGTHISEYLVLSLKVSSRERSKLDSAWTFTHKPKRFYYGSITDDYPQPKKFKESETRKLVCATPKKEDSRMFKLDFETFVKEIKTLLTEEGCLLASP